MTRRNVINDNQLVFTLQNPAAVHRKEKPPAPCGAGGKPGETFKNYRLDYIVSVPRRCSRAEGETFLLLRAGDASKLHANCGDFYRLRAFRRVSVLVFISVC